MNTRKCKLCKYFLGEHVSRTASVVIVCMMAAVCSGQIKFDPKQYVRMPYNADFYVAKYEVTNAQYREFLESIKKTGKYQTDFDVETSGSFGSGVPMNEYWTKSNFNNYPVVNISHAGAVAYCKWLTEQFNLGAEIKIMVARLPSEKEWILAALGTSDTTQYSPAVNQLQVPEMLPSTRYFAWNGQSRSAPGVYNANINYHASNAGAAGASPFLDGFAYTAPVTEFQPNNFGIYNAVGNVAEMVEQHGRAKGGSWNSFIEECYLNKSTPYDEPNEQTGFRVVVQWLQTDNRLLINAREKALKYYQDHVRFLEVKSGETVADVGAGNGWVTGIHMLIPDFTCTFFAEDIDPEMLNERDFNYMVSHYKDLNGGNTDDTYHYQIGNETSTLLPKNTFNRVLLRLTYHEITSKDEMLADIQSILKPGGVLVIAEDFTEKPGKKRKDCKHPMPVETEVKEKLKLAGFQFQKKFINAVKFGLTYLYFIKPE